MRSVPCLALLGLVAAVPALAQQQTASALGNSETVRRAEETLKQEGYLGDADGVFDGATRSAILKFQEQRGLHITGELDTETLSSLGVDHQDGEQAQARDAPGEQQVGPPPTGPQVGKVPER